MAAATLQHVCLSALPHQAACPSSDPPPGPSPDGRRAGDGRPAHDVQPARPQTHQPVHADARSSGQLGSHPLTLPPPPQADPVE